MAQPKILKFTNPDGKTLSINSPDGSVPNEVELDIMFKKAYPKATLYSEVGAPLLHGVSSFAFGIPKLTARATGAEEYMYPEQQTIGGKILRGGAETAGIIGGGIGKVATKVGQKFIPKLATEALRRKASRYALEGGLTGLLMPPKQGTLAPQERLQTGLGASALSGGAPYAVKGAQLGGQLLAKGAGKVGGFVARNIAGYSKSALNTINKFGFDKVQKVSQKGYDYLAKEVIPVARERVIDSITKLGKNSKDLLENLGFNPEEITDIYRVSKDNLIKLKSLIAKNWVGLDENLNTQRQTLGQQIGQVYDIAESNGNTIQVNSTINLLKRKLLENGLITKAGELFPDAINHPSQTLRTLAKIYSEYNGFKELGIPQFRNMMSKLESAIRPDERFNIYVYPVIKKLRDDSVKSLQPVNILRNVDFAKLNKDYSDITTLQNLGSKLNKAINISSDKLETDFSKIKNQLFGKSREKYSNIYGKELIDKMDLLEAAMELNPEKTGYKGLAPLLARGVTNLGLKTMPMARQFTQQAGKFTQPMTQGFPINQLAVLNQLIRR